MLRDDACALRKRFTKEIRPLPYGSEEPGAAVRRASELRGFCRRIFGWDDAQREAVDDVMCALLAAVVAGAAIALRGEPDLVPVAPALHRRLLGPERPFVVCDPRRRDGDGSVRSAPNRRRGMDALVAATGGSVCLRARRLPADFAEMADSLRGSGSTAQVFVCLSGDDRMRVRDLLSPPVEIPSLSGRAEDLDRLIGESLADATRALGVGRMRFSGRASDSVLRGVTSLAEFERGVLRLVAIRSAPNLSQAARRLGVALVSLSRWVGRRGRAAVFRDVACLEHDDDDGAKEEVDGQELHRTDIDAPGEVVEAQRTAGPTGIAPIDESRRSPIEAARRLLRRQP
jgi:hypothetical protein